MPKFTTPQLSWLTTLGKEADICLLYTSDAADE